MLTATATSCQQKKQAIELTAQMISKFWPKLTLATRSITTIKMTKGDIPIQNDETQFNCT